MLGRRCGRPRRVQRQSSSAGLLGESLGELTLVLVAVVPAGVLSMLNGLREPPSYTAATNALLTPPFTGLGGTSQDDSELTLELDVVRIALVEQRAPAAMSNAGRSVSDSEDVAKSWLARGVGVLGKCRYHRRCCSRSGHRRQPRIQAFALGAGMTLGRWLLPM